MESNFSKLMSEERKNSYFLENYPDKLLKLADNFWELFGTDIQKFFSSYAIRKTVGFHKYDSDFKPIPGTKDKTLALFALYLFLAQKLEASFPDELKESMDDLRNEIKTSKEKRRLWRRQNFLWRQNTILMEFVESKKCLESGFQLLETGELEHKSIV